MARNQEKAHTLMNKWVTAKHRMRLGQTTYVFNVNITYSHRPLSAYECKTSQECLYWRNDILKELKKKLGQIQNRTLYFNVYSPLAGLPAQTLRDLNDEVNRLIRSKGHWERRIRELGGVIMDMADQLDTDSDDSSALFVGGGNVYKYIFQ